MARKTVIISDLSGEEGAEEVSFSWDGQAYTIDLLETEKGELAKLLAPYLKEEFKVKAGTIKATPKKKDAGLDAATVRAWVLENGVKDPDGKPLSDRGRVPEYFREQYRKAHA
ncbi:Lsr2 family protein [Streptomyces coacervatus]|uniref:Lsr2 family protein n=1 Tax=Streptomyces coacervatus TaxID=647381 RepID=A0ABP7HJ29_9ACTN|nr:histone-like nucleoid-structuring protein Lsr2 [Streptomyces coacervatus]MDF2272380.1 Lsr2 family protein [Streptomyces coacervatus]